MIGHNVSHSKRRTQKIFLPNLHPLRVVGENGVSKKMKFCTKCLRLVKTEQIELRKKLAEAKKARLEKSKSSKAPKTTIKKSTTRKAIA